MTPDFSLILKSLVSLFPKFVNDYIILFSNSRSCFRNLMAKTAKTSKTAKKGLEPVTRDTTIHLAKMTYKKTFKKRAPTALRRIKEFVQKVMLTKDVRVESNLNKFIWSKGIKNLPTRVRVRMSRRRNENEDAKEKMYTLVQHIPVESFEGLQTEVVADE